MTRQTREETLDLYGMQELCRRDAMDENFILQCVELGIVGVAGQAAGQWQFSTAAVLRIRKAWRLHHELELDLGNLGLVLELLEERETLQREVDALRGRLRRWENEMPDSAG